MNNIMFNCNEFKSNENTNQLKEGLTPVCPECGSKEINYPSPKTHYECGSCDYDQKLGTFTQSPLCKDKVKVMQAETISRLIQDLEYLGGIVEKGTGKPLDKNISLTTQVLDYVQSKEADADRLAEALIFIDCICSINPKTTSLSSSNRLSKIQQKTRAALAAHEDLGGTV
ncbi:MAG: hypothetical protein AB7V16_07140 [Vulcanibacillus sp.]